MGRFKKSILAVSRLVKAVVKEYSKVLEESLICRDYGLRLKVLIRVEVSLVVEGRECCFV